MKKGKIIFLKNEFGYWTGVISGITSLILAFIKVDFWVNIIWLSIVSINIIWLSIRFFKFLRDSAISQKELEEYYNSLLNENIQVYYNQHKLCCEKIHTFLHNIRDYCGDYSKCEDQMLEQICVNTCSYIENIFTSLWQNNKVSVCIKKIVTDNIMNNNFEEWGVATIARSAGTKQDRYQLYSETPLISENSDFKIIISPKYKDSVFSCLDLTKVDEEFIDKYGEKYKNSTLNYLDKYKSTIVAPIRIKINKANPIIKPICNKDHQYHLVGFLCIDTEDIFKGDSILFNSGIELAKGFADALYKLFENNIIIHKERESLIV